MLCQCGMTVNSLYCVVSFLFKQKTAYEMRISDWSSDVCSSDLEGPDGIGAVLRGLERFGWEPILEGGNTIALTKEGCSITLEPGGQFELSGAPLETLHQTCDEVQTHLAQVKAVGDELGIGMIEIGRAHV